MNRRVGCLSVALTTLGLAAVAHSSDLHFSAIYWHEDLGRLTQRLPVQNKPMRESYAFVPDPTSLEVDWASAWFSRWDDEEIRAEKRLRAVMGDAFVDKAILSRQRDRHYLGQLRRPDTELLLMAQSEGRRFNPEWAEEYWEVRSSGGWTRHQDLIDHADSRTRRMYADFALANYPFDPQQRANALIAFGKQHPDSELKPFALLRAATSLLLSEKLTAEHSRYWTERVGLAELLLWQFLSQYPDHELFSQAVGWMGYVHRIRGDAGGAYVWYLKQLANTQSLSQQIQAYDSLDITPLSDTQRKELNEAVRQAPRLLLVYVEHQVIDRDSPDFAALARLVEDSVALHGEGRISPLVFGYLASAAYDNADYSSATEWAERAIASGDKTAQAIGFYMRGSVKKKRGDDPGAISDYKQCLRRPGYESLHTGARENLAYLQETSGLLGEALDSYFELGYTADIAYLLDIRMPPEAIDQYIQTHFQHPKLPVLRFSLGMRWLRRQEFAKAAAQFRKIPSAQLRKLAFLDEEFDAWGWARKEKYHDPCEVLSTWQTLARRVERSQPGEERAKAAYELASFFYEERNLQLYNPTLWRGSRDGYLTDLKTEHRRHLRLDFDSEKYVVAHCQEHEALYRARDLYLEILDQYPDSEVAPKAAYRAADASHRLANFNRWWREYAGEAGLVAEAADLMGRVVR